MLSKEMPSELEELVEFLHHGNTQIRQIAVENLVPYSQTQPAIFKTGQLKPVIDLKLLIRDYAPIAKNALTILINISSDADVRKSLAEDDVFLESVLLRITNPKAPTANELSMLLANLSKSSSLMRILTLKLPPIPALGPAELALDQLIDLFNVGADGKYNPAATYDYLAYVFADVAKHPPTTTHLLTPSATDPLPPLTKLLPSTTSASLARRTGLALLLKNLTLALPSPSALLSPPISILPFVLQPLCGPHTDSISVAETESLLPELQYLGAEQAREPDARVLGALLECVYLLAVKGGTRAVRKAGAYVVVRECHAEVEDEGVRERCERLVHVLMLDEDEAGAERTEAGEGSAERIEAQGDSIPAPRPNAAADDDDDDNTTVQIF